MDLTLPAQFYRGKTIRVLDCDCLLVNLRLNFDIQIIRRVLIEGVQKRNLNGRQQEAAKRALIVLTGKKRLLLQVAENCGYDRSILGRVYLAEDLGNPPEGCMGNPAGVPMMEIGLFMSRIADSGFDIEVVKHVIGTHRWNGDEDEESVENGRATRKL
jgi:hypothetical protein